MSSSELSPRDFLGTVFCMVFGIVLAVLGWTWLVDPTGLLRQTFGGPKVCRSYTSHPVGLLAPALAATKDWPEAIWLGSSRVSAGFPGEGPADLGISSASMAEISTIGIHAIRSGKVREIRIGLELGQFSNPDRVADRGIAYDWSNRSYPSLRYGLLDRKAVAAALEGCKTPRWPSFMISPQAAERALLFSLNGAKRLTPRERDAFYRTAFSDLAKFLAEAHARRVRVTLFIGPNRSSYWNALQRAGFQQFHTEWRGELSALAQRYDAAVLDIDRIAIPNLTCPGSPDRDCHFLDTIHYSAQFGAGIAKIIKARDRISAN
jgi:hypothetical protein